MSIRMLLVPILMAAGAGACAHAPRGEASAPLAARLSVTASGMDVGLSDQAHIAVFAVTPGQGVTLVYPEPHERTLYTAGWTTLAHNPAGRGSYEPRLARFLSPSASTVMVLVASREPIDVRRFAAGASLERALGHRVYRSYDADAIIGGITRLTVAGVDDGDWAMDVNAIPVTRTGAGYALLDEARYPAENPFVTVYCSAPGTHGLVMVHMEFARYACSPADPPAQSDSTVTNGNGMSASRAGITRRTFAPADEAAAARGVGRERTETAGRTRATGAEGQADRRVRAPRESSTAGSGAATRVQEAPARGGGGDGGGRERAAGGAGERGARQP